MVFLVSADDLPEEELQKIDQAFISRSSPSTGHRPPECPSVFYHSLVRVPAGSGYRNIKLCAFNPPCCLSEDTLNPQSFARGNARLSFGQRVSSGTNIVHALLCMYFDARDTAMAHKELAEQNAEMGCNSIVNCLKSLLDSKDYEPVVDSVKSFVSQASGHEVPLDKVKEIALIMMNDTCAASFHSDLSKACFIGSVVSGACGAVSTAVNTFLTHSWVASSVAGLGFFACAALAIGAYYERKAADEKALSAASVGETLNIATMLLLFKNFIFNRPSYVASCNYCLMAYDDFSDFRNTETSLFTSRADILKDYENKGGMCDFLFVRGANFPTFGEWRPEGVDIFNFYKGIIRRLNSENLSSEEFAELRDVLMTGVTTPEGAHSSETSSSSSEPPRQRSRIST